jgi:hypothetical protein
MTGRPTKLTPELTERLCEEIRKPRAISHACAAVGLHRATFHRWIADAEAEDAPAELCDFRDEVARARADAAQILVDAIEKRALGYEVVKHTRGGEEIREWDSDWKAAAWLLERTAPDEYGNRTKVEHSGSTRIDIALPPGAGDAAAAFVQTLGDQADGKAAA